MARMPRRSRELWVLAGRQHGVVARRQLIELGLGPAAIRHRIATGWLHPIWRSVYAVGRPDLSRRGLWMGAVLACGPSAVLSHEPAGILWEIWRREAEVIDVTVPGTTFRRHSGIFVHRRRSLRPSDVTICEGIPVTTPARTVIDLATRHRGGDLEAAINACDRLDLLRPDELRAELEDVPGMHGSGVVRSLLERRMLALVDSELERMFLPIAARAGLPAPLTQQWLNGFRVDFYWPELGLVVETDGLRYHRTPTDQARDRVRDQEHARAGLTPLRFTHAQVAYQPHHVQMTLSRVAERLRTARAAA